MSQRHLYENGIKGAASLSQRDTLRHRGSLMSDWDSNPDVFCQHGVVWSGITHREQAGHHTFDSDGLVCVCFMLTLRESRLCLKNRKWNHQLFLSFGSCFWAATAKDAGIYCLVKEYLSHSTFPSALWDIKCPTKSPVTFTTLQNGTHHGC